jgi:hypothetical protein
LSFIDKGSKSLLLLGEHNAHPSKTENGARKGARKEKTKVHSSISLYLVPNEIQELEELPRSIMDFCPLFSVRLD